jgi:hypothetical protein
MQGNQGQEVNRGELSVEIEVLSAKAKGLCELMGQLSARLEPVCRPATPKTMGGTPVQGALQGPSSAHAQLLRATGSIIQDDMNTLTDILSRLEV